MDKRGMTFIELLIVLALVVIVVSVVNLVLKGGLAAWNTGESEVALQRQAQRIIEEIMEGNDEVPGIREALEVTVATPVSLGFIPLWTDTHPDCRGQTREFTLTKKFKPGASIPIGQMRLNDSKKFISVPLIFKYAKAKDFEVSDNIVKFVNPIPEGSDVRILFHPDASDDNSVIMRYYWDDETKRAFRTYKGKTEDIIKYDKKIKVVDFKFSYYDNLNNLLVPVYGTDVGDIESSSSSGARKSLSAIGINLVVERGSAKRELSSFASIRALGGNLGTGIALAEDAEIKIPDSQHIRTLVLDNLAGVEDNDSLEIEISSFSGRIWKISIEFGIIDEAPYILGFNVEYPKGTVVYSNKRQRAVKGGLNLLKLGNDYYDYDDDKNVDDIVNIEAEETILKVTRMDLEAAAVFVRP